MADTFTCLHIHVVFATRFREAAIGRSWCGSLHQFITACFQQRGHKILQINSMPDHMHILFGLDPMQAISPLIQVVKSESSKWINSKRLTQRVFQWQSGYGAFAVEKRRVPTMIDYIRDQDKVHSQLAFLAEYRQLLLEAEADELDFKLFREPA